MVRIVLLWFLALPLWGAVNTVEEARLTAELDALAPVSRLLHLQLGGHSFTAVLDESRLANTRGLVILLPEAGWRADAGLMRVLRRVLPGHGWGTLSLQLPVLEPEARREEYLGLLPEAAARLETAVKVMKGEGMRNIALAGHGFGALTLLRYLGGEPDEAVRAVVLLSPWWPGNMIRQLQQWLRKVTIPVLDVRAERDAREVLQSAVRRHLILKGRSGYRQWRITGVGHRYRGREVWLAERIYGWLQRVAPGVEVRTDD